MNENSYVNLAEDYNFLPQETPLQQHQALGYEVETMEGLRALHPSAKVLIHDPKPQGEWKRRMQHEERIQATYACRWHSGTIDESALSKTGTRNKVFLITWSPGVCYAASKQARLRNKFLLPADYSKRELATIVHKVMEELYPAVPLKKMIVVHELGARRDASNQRLVGAHVGVLMGEQVALTKVKNGLKPYGIYAHPTPGHKDFGHLHSYLTVASIKKPKSAMDPSPLIVGYAAADILPQHPIRKDDANPAPAKKRRKLYTDHEMVALVQNDLISDEYELVRKIKSMEEAAGPGQDSLPMQTYLARYAKPKDATSLVSLAHKVSNPTPRDFVGPAFKVCSQANWPDDFVLGESPTDDDTRKKVEFYMGQTVRCIKDGAYQHVPYKEKVALVILGDSNKGKSGLAEAVLGEKFYRVTDLSQLDSGEFRTKCKAGQVRGILLDDFDPNSHEHFMFNPSNLKHLLSVDEDRSVRVCGGTIDLPGGVPLVITSQAPHPYQFIPRSYSKHAGGGENTKACSRRVRRQPKN